MCTKGDFVEFDLTNTARKKNEDGTIKRRNMKSRLESKKVAYKDYDITLIRSNRKSIAIEINRDLQIKVRAPQRMTQNRIMKFVTEKEDWIQLHLEKMELLRQKQEQDDRYSQRSPLTEEEIRKLTETARKVITVRVAYFARQMEVTYGRITIRNQKTRWGSCSQAGNLNFNCHLAEMPDEILDYVVVHELCHRKQMNHSRLFWAEVEKVLPDYQIRRKWLKENGRRYLT